MPASPSDPGPHGSSDRPSTAPTKRPPGSLKVGSIAGSDVLISSSWFVVAALIAVLVAPIVDQVQPGLGALKYVAGAAFAVLLYGSVLLHEASHALVARRLGFTVSSITLHFLGGMTSIEGEARRPREEFAIAVVGPLTSIAVGLGALALRPVTPDGLLLLAVEGLVVANLLVGVLNLVPGLPLDGGRVLKSLVWGVTGSVHRGTVVAAWGGRLTAVAVLVWPLVQAQVVGSEPDLLDFVLVLIISMFLWTGATAALVSARLRSRLPSLQARGLARRTLSVPADLPLAEAVRRANEVQAGGIVTLTADGAPLGLVNEAALLATPQERRPWVPVSSVTRTLETGLRLPVGIGGEELVRAITSTPATEYLLVHEDGSIYGVLATEDVDRAFRESR
ncbi:Putative zinc metalloprotease Rip3 [Nocardioides dokdonensis FR1436]|uniref:Zinc metalloprotease n=1 Tax=Nocardioides dokdonensis FR1436 TaxID=1300347 RepID=A0A1A9GN52_9ACTN|nr:site-2 protease family protein [Nocardioides dokdonensis]ANH39728.1 Putative zinc metalloprotease Rip3 [Nocardioides dokdonensis FR1436]